MSSAKEVPGTASVGSISSARVAASTSPILIMPVHPDGCLVRPSSSECNGNERSQHFQWHSRVMMMGSSCNQQNAVSQAEVNCLYRIDGLRIDAIGSPWRVQRLPILNQQATNLFWVRGLNLRLKETWCSVHSQALKRSRQTFRFSLVWSFTARVACSTFPVLRIACHDQPWL